MTQPSNYYEHTNQFLCHSIGLIYSLTAVSNISIPKAKQVPNSPLTRCIQQGIGCPYQTFSTTLIENENKTTIVYKRIIDTLTFVLAHQF